MSASVTAPPGEGRAARRQGSWGLIDQSFSSATNFGLAILAGRLVGASGLGVVYLGFSLCFIALNLQRALISEPLVVRSARAREEGSDVDTRHAIGVVTMEAVALTAVMLALGLVLPRPFGTALLLFSPWLAATLFQDLWRSILFRDRRGSAAAMNDGLWLAVMVAALPVALVWRHEATVVLTWGIGALAGALLGFWQVRLRPAAPAASLRWWLDRALPLGRWLAAQTGLLLIQVQVVVLMLTAFLGTADVGGMRSVETVFAPMTLLSQAVSFPALPMLVRVSAEDQDRARVWAFRVSLATMALVVLYLGAVLALGSTLLTFLFGSKFTHYASLAIPVGVRQLVLAAGIGFSMLAKAEGRGSVLVAARIVGATSTVVLVLLIAPRFGLMASLWAMTAGITLGSLCMTVLALRRDRRGARQPVPASVTSD